MCGIAGFVGEGDAALLRRMTDVQAHRGPDGEGLWFDRSAGVFLGHRRLSILDIAGGHQPMWTADGALGIVFNGEIYNHMELRSELIGLGHRFQTDHSDTEVLLYGFRQWDAEVVSRLNGMWAFAIYDRTRQRLFCSRDRFGKKPLFYAFDGRTFAFASELNALALHPCVDRSLSHLALKKYFGYGYIPAPHTIYAGARKLPGGHSLVLDIPKSQISIRKYWDFVLEPFESIPQKPEQAWGEELRALLDRAVRRRLVSDVPLGTFLSGGIDSSAVTAFAARHTGGGKLNTFSIGFQEASFDESAAARRVAEHLDTVHHPEVLSMERARELLPEVVGRIDEPMGDSSLLPTYLLCRHARQRVTVALGGDGADELFAGYDPFHALHLARLYQALVPRPIHRAIRLLATRLPVSHAKMSLDFRIKRALRGVGYPPALWNPAWMSTVDPEEFGKLLEEPADIEEVFSEAIEYWDGCRQDNLVDRTIQYYVKLYLQDDILVKVDRASMMNSLEARAPFLDIELVDFIRRIPHEYKYRHGQTKYILKKALEPVLPRDVLYRKKQGFGVPVGRWFREGAFSTDAAPGAGPVPRAFVETKQRSHAAGRSDERAFLWNHWVLQHWIGQNSDPPPIKAGAAAQDSPLLRRVETAGAPPGIAPFR
jgi:asparagine synthase (glutamine-hydrolysing)